MTPMQIILAVLTAGNFLLGWAWLGARDDATTARADLVSMTGQRDGLRTAAQACSDGVDGLASAAAKREELAAPARAAAAAQAQAHNKRADYTLSRPPAGESCAGLQSLGDEWLKGRVKP
ncbi:hypothetical protein ACFIQG_21290 [Comamonas odontotermitis]|uniref:hypothetical protein n=1 Tax=Comamonas odontotermitis TaxID=379895 RepID=UPI0036735ED7